jgi:nitrite reductase/ring-hydroxylating ferredoxin subunit
MQKKYKWYKIAEDLLELGTTENGLQEIELGGKKICLAIKNDEVLACAAKCPHAGGQMSQGYIDALGNIVCPLHRYKFSLQNGRNITGEGYFLKTYPIEKRENGIFIGIEEQGLFNW